MKFRRILVFALAILFCFSVCACGDDASSDISSNQQESKTEPVKKPMRFSVTVVDQNGDFVEGVILKLEKTSRVTARTNEQGVATFPAVNTDGYMLSVVSCPKGYTCDGAPSVKIKAETEKFLLKIIKE